ncbi:hypothetical protein V8F20_008313 [Naviculisporaceae sp. PSN 640]
MEPGFIRHAQGHPQKLVRRRLLGMSIDDQLDLLQELISDDPDHKFTTLLAQVFARKEREDIDIVWDAFACVEKEHDHLDANEDYFTVYEYPNIDLNPWIDLPLRNLDHAGGELSKVHSPSFTATTAHAPFRFKQLPPELILMVAECLPFESQVVLAFTDRHLHGLVGRLVFNPEASPDRVEKFKALRLLERDNPDMVACPSCSALHPPQLSVGPVADRQCSIHEMHIDVDGVPEFISKIPSSLNYNVIRALAMQRTRDLADGTDGCGSILELFRESDTVAFTALKAISSSLAMFVPSGNLVLRTQLLACPATRKYYTPNSIAFLKDCLSKDNFKPCPHISQQVLLHWHDRIWITRKQSVGWNAGDQSRWSSRHDRAYDNPAGDSPETDVDHNLHPALQMIFQQPQTRYFGHCEQCLTEFSMTVQDVPSVGPSLCMTVWKDLGGPCNDDRYSQESMRRFKWDSHCRLEWLPRGEIFDLGERMRRVLPLSDKDKFYDSSAYAFEALLSDTAETQRDMDRGPQPYIEPIIIDKMAGLHEKASISEQEYCAFFELLDDLYDFP